MAKLTSYRLTWSPSGQYIGTVQARDVVAARRKAPLPYRRFKGEIAVEVGSGPPVIVEEIPVVTRHARMYRIEWYRNGNAFVSAVVNGTLVGCLIDGQWRHDDALPDDIRAATLESKPSAEGGV